MAAKLALFLTLVVICVWFAVTEGQLYNPYNDIYGLGYNPYGYGGYGYPYGYSGYNPYSASYGYGYGKRAFLFSFLVINAFFSTLAAGVYDPYAGTNSYGNQWPSSGGSGSSGVYDPYGGSTSNNNPNFGTGGSGVYDPYGGSTGSSSGTRGSYDPYG